MARHAPLLLFAVLAALAVAAASASAYVRVAADKGDEPMTINIRGGATGQQLVGDEEDEFALGGAIIRRRMQDIDANETTTNDTSITTTTVGYISYGALRPDSVPCGQRGASYYNCRPGAEANPYTRGCSAITQCRG